MTPTRTYVDLSEDTMGRFLDRDDWARFDSNGARIEAFVDGLPTAEVRALACMHLQAEDMRRDAWNDIMTAPLGHPLTKSEMDCLYLRAFEVASIGEVAAVRGTGVRTVKFHLCQAYRKLGTDNLLGAFRALGWLNPLPPA